VSSDRLVIPSVCQLPNLVQCAFYSTCFRLRRVGLRVQPPGASQASNRTLEALGLRRHKTGVMKGAWCAPAMVREPEQFGCASALSTRRASHSRLSKRVFRILKPTGHVIIADPFDAFYDYDCSSDHRLTTNGVLQLVEQVARGVIVELIGPVRIKSTGLILKL
jgi:hypothetical protein